MARMNTNTYSIHSLNRFMGICILSLIGLLSCGLEDVYYIDYIPRVDYGDTSAVISLPSSSNEGYAARPDGYFDNFIIFYRIYISNVNIPTGRQLEGYGTNNDRSTISSTLNSDYTALYSYTDTTSTSVNTSNLENTFCSQSRGYFLLTLKGADINAVLNSDSLGKRLEIHFSPINGEEPYLTIGGGPQYFLQRSVRNEIRNLYDLNPAPDQRFLNDPELYNTANITSGRNADVATNSAAEVQYTYISMYIAARGRSGEMPPRIIYSQPTFIGIFRLAESGS